ncbi:MAG: LysR family transcriptional regulator [Bosea sp.]|uniref:LysR family transcriptional regulator n=1 Tax=Bosea sp. (in: a-proteobacteria) TaxID=1871050 RepID=UPI0023A099E3|nr:LysR family transcriptional regulator [Bosea sp. (in: a-proteobacteria)]MCP4734871.1 LysR family transcriptional regulator [Bosea sp. (in: a-proteobacteria)]
MDTDRIDLNLLRVMRIVDQEGSVTRAAERLGLSQPAISNALTRLRRTLGDPLFVRSSAGMEATPRARRVLDSFDAALGLIRHGLSDLLHFDPATSDHMFELLISDLGEIVYLPKLMRHLQAKAPGIRIRVRQLARGGYAQALEGGLADLAIGYLLNPRGSLKSRQLFSDNFVCMVREGHPILDGPLTLERYLDLAHISIAKAGARESLVTASLAALGVERQIALVIPHFAGTPQIIAATDLAVTVPRKLVDAYSSKDIVSIPLPFETPDIGISMFWHERLQEDAPHRWLRETFVELFKIQRPSRMDTF